MLKDGHQAENKGPQIQTAADEMRVISAVDLVVRLTIRTAGRSWTVWRWRLLFAPVPTATRILCLSRTNNIF